MRILIKNGRLVSYNSKELIKVDILIINETINRIEFALDVDADIIINATGKLIFPGFIDVHTHLREPGFPHKETILSGTRAAAKGGFTTIFCMANTSPVVDNTDTYKLILEKSANEGKIKVLPVGAITKGLMGKELSDMLGMKQLGAIALSDDGHTIKNTQLMREAIELAGNLNLKIIDHCEDSYLANHGSMREGSCAEKLIIRGIPAETEDIIVARDIILAELTGVPIHLAHISSKGSVELIRRAKANGVPITAEVTPHHLVLTELDVTLTDTSTKCNPPLGTDSDRSALIAGIKDGTLDMIASDHAPHAKYEKNVAYEKAPFGMIGLETSVPLVIDRLVHKGLLDWFDLYRVYYLNAAIAFGLPSSGLFPGSIADITIIDQTKKVEISKAFLESKAENSPFLGLVLMGCATEAFVNGKLVLQDGKVI
ncbi:MAG: dihydroorotase [Clostridia bacterium]